MKIIKIILILAASLGVMAFTLSHRDPGMTIAVAADLKFAMDSIVTSFKAQNPGSDIDVTYGSSGKFFEQISNGAPYDIFFSADIDYPMQLKNKGRTLGIVKTYGIGQIVLWSKKRDPNTEQMQTLLDAGISKIAVANPAHAPYGKRAEESLRYYKLYDQVKGKLVFGENISQTAQYVTTGAADIGIVALSMAVSPAMKKEGGKYYLIPEQSHSPLEQAYTLLKHSAGNSNAGKFYDFISSPTAVNILKYFGFAQKTS